MEALQAFDLALFHWLRPLQSPAMDRAMIWISAGGGAGFIWLTLGLAALAHPIHRAAAWRVFLTIGLAYLLVDGVFKPAIARPRPASIIAIDPPRELPPLPRSFSFPSGHAA